MLKKLDAYNGKLLPYELNKKLEEIRNASDEALKKLKAIGNDIVLKRAEKELALLSNWERDVGPLENAGGNKN